MCVLVGFGLMLIAGGATVAFNGDALIGVICIVLGIGCIAFVGEDLIPQRDSSTSRNPPKTYPRIVSTEDESTVVVEVGPLDYRLWKTEEALKVAVDARRSSPRDDVPW